MGYSGLIYAAIVAAWAAFLVPRWVRRNEEVERAREADVERGVRVLSRKAGPPQAPHGSVTLPAPAGASAASGAAAGSVAGPAPELPDGSRAPGGPSSATPAADVFAVAARRRRRMLGALLVLLIASAALVLLGRAPAWAPLGPGALLAVFLFLARRAAVVQARRRRAQARRAAADRRRSAAREAAAVWAAPSEAADEGAPRRLILPDEIAEPAPSIGEGEEWSPVPVPLPTYLTKPKATRPAARTIDLSQPGAWTSGRLDPASSIQLPHRAPDERPAASAPEPAETTGSDEVVEERRRAVGD